MFFKFFIKVSLLLIFLTTFFVTVYSVYKVMHAPIGIYSLASEQCVMFINYKGDKEPCDLNSKHFIKWIE